MLGAIIESVAPQGIAPFHTLKSRMRRHLMWPSKILALFDAVDWQSSDPSELYGPYNALLDFCFPWELGWSVALSYTISGKEANPVFIASCNRRPALCLIVKPASHSHQSESRAAADEDIQRALGALSPAPCAPILHGLVAYGSQVSHYTLHTATYNNSLSKMSNQLQPVTDAAAHSLDMDILQEPGVGQFQDIVKLASCAV